MLKNYFWNEPSQIPTVGKILTDICENPIGAKTQELVEMANESFSELDDYAAGKDRGDAEFERQILKIYMKVNKELVRIYSDLVDLKNDDLSESDCKTVDGAAQTLEDLSCSADDIARTPHIALSEKMRLNV